MKKKNVSSYAVLDVVKGRQALAKRLTKSERIEVVIRGVLNPNPLTWSDDTVSIEFPIENPVWEEVESGSISYPFKTRTTAILGPKVPDALSFLFEVSAWFVVKPLPNDVWEITVKDEQNLTVRLKNRLGIPE